MTGSKFGTLIAAIAIALALGLAPAASAAVIGHLDVANCAGGGVTVTATSIDWTPPTDGTNGCIQSGTGTNITFSGGTLGPGAAGLILDLTAANPLPVVDFITFTGIPSLHFDLMSLGPGPTSTTCSSALNPNAPACAAFAGSPFILQSTATGTSVTLSAMGVARDGTTPTSNWLGAFTTQIAGITPAQIQTAILGGGSETSTFSGDFSITVVPEPATLSFMGLGSLLIGLGLIRRKRSS